MKRIFAILLVFIAFFAKAQTPGENFDVMHYDINLLNFDFTEHTLQGDAYINLIATTTTNTFVFE